MEEQRARIRALPTPVTIRLREIAAAGEAGSVVLLNGTGEADRSQMTGGLVKAMGRPVHRVPLARVVSKYIGETEKNLARCFVTARREHAVLLFDEADALFGKRTEVRDSHDRYANQQAGRLLAMIEQYDGVVLLASNRQVTPPVELLRHLLWVVELDAKAG